MSRGPRRLAPVRGHTYHCGAMLTKGQLAAIREDALRTDTTASAIIRGLVAQHYGLPLHDVEADGEDNQPMTAGSAA